MITFLRRRGFKFYDWATGHNVLQCLDELSQTQWLSPDELRALQIHRLQSLLEHAYTYVPYYRRVFDEVGFRPGNLVQDPESFHKIPPYPKHISAAILRNFSPPMRPGEKSYGQTPPLAQRANLLFSGAVVKL